MKKTTIGVILFILFYYVFIVSLEEAIQVEQVFEEQVVGQYR